MEEDSRRGKKNVLPYGESPKIGSPEPAPPDFYLYRRACLMVGGYLQLVRAAFQGWVLNIPEELSANYCLAWPRPGPPCSPELPCFGQRILVVSFLGHMERPRSHSKELVAL